VLDNRKVVRNKDKGEVEVFLQSLQQVEGLRLNGHIQRGYRLVANDQARVER
jgi:hypothetical protein